MKIGDLIIDKTSNELLDILIIEKILSETEAIGWIRYTSSSIKTEQVQGLNYHNEFHYRNSRINVDEDEEDSNKIDLTDYRLVADGDFPPEIIAKAREVL